MSTQTPDDDVQNDDSLGATTPTVEADQAARDAEPVQDDAAPAAADEDRNP